MDPFNVVRSLGTRSTAASAALQQQLIDSVSSGVPVGRGELVTLGPTLKQRAADVLAHFPDLIRRIVDLAELASQLDVRQVRAIEWIGTLNRRRQPVLLDVDPRTSFLAKSFTWPTPHGLEHQPLERVLTGSPRPQHPANYPWCYS